MRRPSSEFFVERITLRVVGERTVGGVIALGGSELSRCRGADVLAALALAGPKKRGDLVRRIRASQQLFPPVGADEFYVSRVWVEPGARGEGHGKALFREGLAAGARRGFQRFRIDVWSGNRVALGIYRARGFELERESVSEEAGMSYLNMVLVDPPPSRIGGSSG
jgi:ribosomal protein S18 acetylase RimI-like enzyme